MSQYGPGLHRNVALMSYRATALVALVVPDCESRARHTPRGVDSWRVSITPADVIPIVTRLDRPPLLTPDKVHIHVGMLIK